MASYVVKVQFEDSMRRLTLGRDAVLSFAQLESRTRELFQIPASSQVVLTYVDSDGDVVTMAEDQDLRDALVLQSLNPLRLSVAILPRAKGNAAADVKTAEVSNESAPAGKWSENDTGARLNADAAPAAKAEKEDEKAAGKDADAAAATGEAEKEEQVIHHGITCDDCGMSPIAGPRFKSTKKYDYDLCHACFNKPEVDPNEYFMVERRFRPPTLRQPLWGPRMMRLNPAFDSRNPNSRNARPTGECARTWGSRCPGAEGFRGTIPEDCRAPRPAADQEEQNADTSASDVVHRGVKCDGCGANPITGPRFKSNTRFDYDLCSGCFEKSEDGIKKEYSRIDRPVNGVHPVVVGRWYSATPPHRTPMCGRGIWVINRWAQEQNQKKEAEKEAEKEAANQHSTEENSAAAEDVPKEATQPSTEENSTAAEAVPKETTQPSTEENSAAAEAIPKEATQPSTEENSAAAEAIPKEATLPSTEETSAAAAATPAPEKQAEVPAVTKETPVAQTESTQQAESVEEPETEKKTSLPQADGTVEDGTVPVPVNSVQSDTAAPAAPAAPEGDDLSTFDGLLTKLATMGFTDKQLNEELLKKNKMDLRTTLDDLCAAEEWDPILEELQEMGFYDNDMNRRLMFANNGSVKRVVKELVQKAKVPATATVKGEKQA